ncbi:MAG TPA: ELWxxDGT repeat protein [Thermoanaerobaculia bacterium]|nr:ELWxxDGT repeat protein [Thermoanaerobaculia bacterium]
MPTTRLTSPSILLLAGLLTPSTQAQVASLVADLTPFERELSAFTTPPGPVWAVGGRVVFWDLFEQRLWGSDGTAEGTELLLECEGLCTSVVEPFPAVFPGTPAQGPLMFRLLQEEQGSSARTLWRTDGTLAGTFSLASSRNTLLDGVWLGPRFVFRSESGEGVAELRATDGTVAGTLTLTSLDFVSEIHQVQAAGEPRGTFFGSEAEASLQQLWVTDGTPEGTRQLVQLPANTFLRAQAVGSRLFYALHTPTASELWVSDLTVEGTTLVSHFERGMPPFSTGFHWLQAAGQHLYFLLSEAGDDGELWRSDGTALGTRRITNLPELGFDPIDGGQITPRLVELPGKVVFAARTADDEIELWSTSGRPNTTVKLDVCPGECSGVVDQRDPPFFPFFPSSFFPLLELDGRAYFAGTDGAHGNELWQSDGTPEGTHLVTDLCNGLCGEVFGLQVLGDELVFVGLHNQHGRELWAWRPATAQLRRLTTLEPADPFQDFAVPLAARVGDTTFVGAHLSARHLGLVASDGTPESTRLVSPSQRGVVSTNPFALGGVGDRAVFASCSRGDLDHLWAAGGAAPVEALISLPEIGPGVCPNVFGPWPLPDGRALLYRIEDLEAGVATLVRTDGTAEGTLALATAPFERDFVGEHFLGILGTDSYLLWRSDRAAGVTQVLSTDGTAAGTSAAAFTLPNEVVGWIRASGSVGSRLVFLADDTPGGDQLWTSDGTPAGTERLDAFAAPSFFSPGHDLEPFSGRLFFFAAGAQDGLAELWATDGTEGGTGAVARPGGAGYYGPMELEVMGGTLFALAPDAVGEQILWAFYGSGDLVAVATVSPAAQGSDAGHLVATSGQLFFLARDQAHGLEPWRSDGTAEGTSLLADLRPGSSSPTIRELAVAGERLFFTLSDGIHGRELWTSDGTAVGTRMVHDLAPGPAGSEPEGLHEVGGRLYFNADDGAVGREPWSLPLVPPPSACGDSPQALCLNEERFRIEVAWTDFEGNMGLGRPLPLTADTGAFWFFNPENLELMTKVLDGRTLNDHFWVFRGALTNVAHDLTVTDVETGLTRRYRNPSGRFASAGDTDAFGPNGIAFASFAAPAEPGPSGAGVLGARSDLITRLTPPPCFNGPENLCLGTWSAYDVRVSWRDFQGNVGAGQAIPLTGDTGAFWFFDPANVELVVKWIDGRELNDHVWIFYGSLSSVEFTLTVEDRLSSQQRVYFNPSGTFASVGDTEAFPE